MKAKQIEISFSPFFLLLVFAAIFFAGLFVGRANPPVDANSDEPEPLIVTDKEPEYEYQGYYGDRGIDVE